MSLRNNLWPAKPPLTEENLPDQQGKVFIVTGGSGGVGKELVAILYQRNAKVYIAARSEPKTDEAMGEIRKLHPSSRGEMIYLSLQLHDLATIKASAQQFLARESRLDVLWNNAGVMIPPQGSTTVQGYELQLGVNVLGHWLFVHFLHGILADTAKTAPSNSVRVVWVSSDAIARAPKPVIDFGNMDYRRDEDAWAKYGRSKAGNALHATEMARRAASEGIISLVGSWKRECILLLTPC
jgi:NAD(P)-dependent dehydrogenase (short-subunit alcohol dehydrogenase family)